MTELRRFYVNKDRYVVDRLDRSNNGLAWISDGWPDTESGMRRQIFRKRFAPLFEQLLSPYHEKSCGRYKLQMHGDAEDAIVGLASAVGESCAEHAKHPTCAQSPNADVDGTVEGLQDITSIGLFVGDLEALVQTIYGDFEKGASERFKNAVISILKIVMKGPLKHLWHEYHNACVVDGDLRIPGYPAKRDSVDEARASRRLVARAERVKKNPTRFGKYTIRFIKIADADLKNRASHTDEDESARPPK